MTILLKKPILVNLFKNDDFSIDFQLQRSKSRLFIYKVTTGGHPFE